MSAAEYKAEHAYWYSERLALLGFFDTPPDWAHNLAVTEADAHIAVLKRQNREGAIAPLLEFRDSL